MRFPVLDDHIEVLSIHSRWLAWEDRKVGVVQQNRLVYCAGAVGQHFPNCAHRMYPGMHGKADLHRSPSQDRELYPMRKGQ